MALLSLGAAACGDDTTAASVEAGSEASAEGPTGDDAPSANSPSEGASDASDGSDDATPPSIVWTCGASSAGGRPAATSSIDPFPAADAGRDDPDAAAPISGVATFTTTSVGIDLTIRITGCANGSPYPVSIREGSGCAGGGPHGQDGRDGGPSDGFALLTCTGNSGVGTLHYTRPPDDPNPWSIGGPSSSDLSGHVIVVEDPATMQPVACGPIVPLADAGAALPADAALPPLGLLAQVGGFCEVESFSPTPGCPDPARVAACACTHCDLSTCLNDCADYIDCLQAEAGSCTSDCPRAPACSDCMTQMLPCLIGFCVDDVACGHPTPGGPCTRLEACCATQGPRAQSCLGAVTFVEKLGGDTSCKGLMMDQDFLMNTAYDPPCTFDQ